MRYSNRLGATLFVSLALLAGRFAHAQLQVGPADSAGKVGSLVIPNPAGVVPAVRQVGPFIAARGPFDDVVGIGSCFYVDQRGFVATSFSSVEQATAVAVVFNASPNLRYPVLGVVAASRGKDIAILALRGLPVQAVPLPMNAAAEPKLGANVMRWGGPLAEKAQEPLQRDALTAFNRSADFSAVRPKIMRLLRGDEFSLGAAMTNSSNGRDPDTNWIWLDQPCQPSCIGGPVFDEPGNVVGLISGAFDARPEVIAAVHIKHVVELLPAGPVKLQPLTDLRTWVDPVHLIDALPLRDPATKALGGNVDRGSELSERFRDLQRRVTQAEQAEAEAAKTHAALQARGFELGPQIDNLVNAIAAERPEEKYTDTETETRTRRVRVKVKSNKKDKNGKEKDEYEYEDEKYEVEVKVTKYRHSARQLAIIEPLRSELTAKRTEHAIAKEHFRFVGEDLQPFIKRLRARVSEDIFYLADPLGLRSREEHEAFEKLLTEIIDEGGAPAMLYLVRGMSRVNLSRFDDARADLAEALDAEPKLKDLTLAIEARCKIRGGQIPAGLEEIKRAAMHSKNEARVLMIAARTALDRGDMAGATRYLQQAAPTCPDQAEVKLGLAWITSTSPSNVKQAQENAEAAVRLTAGHDWSALLTLAAVHVRTKDFVKATAEADAALRLVPEIAAPECRAWHAQLAAKQPLKREWK